MKLNLILVVLLASSCASAPKPDRTLASIKPPRNGKIQVTSLLTLQDLEPVEIAKDEDVAIDQTMIPEASDPNDEEIPPPPKDEVASNEPPGAVYVDPLSELPPPPDDAALKRMIRKASR